MYGIENLLLCRCCRRNGYNGRFAGHIHYHGVCSRDGATDVASGNVKSCGASADVGSVCPTALVGGVADTNSDAEPVAFGEFLCESVGLCIGVVGHLPSGINCPACTRHCTVNVSIVGDVFVFDGNHLGMTVEGDFVIAGFKYLDVVVFITDCAEIFTAVEEVCVLIGSKSRVGIGAPFATFRCAFLKRLNYKFAASGR